MGKAVASGFGKWAVDSQSSEAGKPIQPHADDQSKEMQVEKGSSSCNGPAHLDSGMGDVGVFLGHERPLNKAPVHATHGSMLPPSAARNATIV